MNWVGRRTARTALAVIALLLVAATESAPVIAQGVAITPRGLASVAVYASESTSSITLAVPAGTQTGDVLVASLGFGSTVATAQPTLGAPPGWTPVSRIDEDVVGSLAVYWHVFAAGETAYSWTTGVKVGGVAFLAAYGGVDTTNPIDASAGQVTTKSVSIVAPAVTTTGVNDLLVASYFGYRSNGGAVTWSPPTGMTEIGDASNTRSRSGSVDVVVQAVAGASGSKTASASGRQDYGIAVLTALRPAPVVGDSTPPAISGVAAGSVSSSGATVSWTTDEPADSQVEYGPTASYGSSTALDPSMAVAHAVALSGLAATTTYHYRVKSRDAAGNLATSVDFSFTTSAAPDTTPPVISGVASGSVSSSGAIVSWATDEASDSQVDYGPTASYGSSTALDPATVTSHSVALSALAAATSYHYRVKSRDAAGNLATSADFTFTTSAVPDTTPPVLSGVAASSVSWSGATVTWSTDEPADSQVDYGTSDSYGSSTALDPAMVTAHSVTLSGLAASTVYHYRVKSRDAAGNLATSADFTFTTSAVPDTTPPVLSGVAASSVSWSGATVTWSTDELADSQVDYGTSDSYGSSTALDPAMVTAHSVTLSGLASSTVYHYRVKSRDAAGNQATSADFTFTTSPAPDTTPPVISGVGAASVSASGATVAWSTDEASDSQVEYGPTSSYGSATTLDPSMVLAHSVVLTGLAAGTTYHYRAKSRDAAGNLGTSSDLTFTTNASGSGPVPIIVDTDIFSDADDVGALATAFGLQIKGEATVIAIGVDTRTSRPAVTTNSWKCVAAIAQFYGAASVPIGSDMPDNGTAANTPDFTGPCAQLASPSTPAPDTAVNVFRSALVSQPNGSVVIVAVGYEENLSNLLHSAPDSISPLNGANLVMQKVKSLVIMGGRYPSGTGETNFAGNAAAAQDIAANWPTKVVYSGTEVGDAVHTGNTISDTHPSNSPVRVAYEAFVGANNWIYSYDLTAVYHAVRPNDSLLTETGPGSNVINGTGGNVFTTGSGNRFYLNLTNATSLDASIEALLDTQPGAASDTTPPVISAIAAGSITTSSATVSWSTNEASDSRVDFGPTSAYGSTTSLPSLVTSHSLSLTPLAAGTLYHYRVKSRDAAGNLATSGDLTFTTASSPQAGPSDNFDGNTIDPAKWTVVQGGSSVAAANQELQFTHPGSASWTKGSIQSVAPYDVTGRCTIVQVKRAANDGLGGASYGETSIFLWVDSSHYVEFFIAGGALTAWVNSGAGEVNLTPSWPRYSATVMQWIRFRESGGTLYWEFASGSTSPGTWTVLASAPDPIALSSVTFKITAGSNVATTDVARFDNISTC